MDYFSCYKCKSKIKKQRVIALGVPDEEIICGTCMKNEYGESFTEMIRSIFDNKEA